MGYKWIKYNNPTTWSIWLSVKILAPSILFSNPYERPSPKMKIWGKVVPKPESNRVAKQIGPYLCMHVTWTLLSKGIWETIRIFYRTWFEIQVQFQDCKQNKFEYCVICFDSVPALRSVQYLIHLQWFDMVTFMVYTVAFIQIS